MRNPSVAKDLKQIVRAYSGWSILNKDPQKGVVPSSHIRLHEVRCPTLAIVGEYDLPDFHVIADMLVGDGLNSRKSVLRGVGHMSNMEDLETFNREVLSFFSSL